MPSNPMTPVHTWFADDPSPPVRDAINRLARAPDVRHVAVMPDIHLAADVCVGCVIATEHLIYPQAVGADIGCGMATCAIDVGASDLRDYTRLDRVLNNWRDAVPTMRHRGRNEAPDLDGLRPGALSDRSLTKLAERLGRVELGTLGRGNHFLELQRDPDNIAWLLVHSGSRAIGPAVHETHLKQASRVRGGLFTLDARTEAGAAYVHDAAWAERYAVRSRRLMLNAAVSAISRALDTPVTPGPIFDTVHNSLRRIDGRLIHRKGANEASRDQPGIIPGSMGTRSAHVVGRGCDRALDSSSHGAGRRMSRGAARARIDDHALRRQLARVHTGPGSLRRFVEEAPAAYRDLQAVLLAQRDLVRITNWLTPMTCMKAGS